MAKTKSPRIPSLRPLELAPYAPADDGRFVHGRILAANDSLINQAFFSEALTAFATGWRDPNDTERLTDVLFPAVEVGRRFTRRQWSNPEEFLSDEDDLRATRADFKSVEYTGTEVEDKTLNRGLAMQIDADEIAGQPDWQERNTERLLRRLRRNTLRRGIALLAAAATNEDKTWDNESDPDGDVEAAIGLAADASGLYPNLVLFGDTAWATRKSAYRLRDSPLSTARLLMSQADLAADLQIDRIEISKERWQSSAAAKSAVVGNKVLIYNAQPNQSLDDPSNIKRFWTPCQAVQDLPGGMRYRVFVRQVSAKLYELVVEHYELLRVTSTLGIRQLTVSKS